MCVDSIGEVTNVGYSLDVWDNGGILLMWCVVGRV